MRSSLIRSFECSCSVSAYLSMPSMRSSRVFGSQPARVIVGRHVQSRDLAAAPGEPAGLSEMSLSLWKSSLALLQASKWRFLSGTQKDRSCLMEPGDRWLVTEVRVAIWSLLLAAHWSSL